MEIEKQLALQEKEQRSPKQTGRTRGDRCKQARHRPRCGFSRQAAEGASRRYSGSNSLDKNGCCCAGKVIPRDIDTYLG